MLEIKNLTKKYGDKVAVDNLSLSLESGKICAFIGKNGAGKTTTLKCCVGMLSFEQGEITINGISVKNDPLAVKKNIAYIPDNPDIYEFMTGIGYLNFIADIFGLSKDVREERIRRIADTFDLTKDLATNVSAYSHGMKQKLVIISALIHEPKLLLMDEPFVGLDPTAAFHLKEEMSALCARGGAILYSTHVLEVAQKLCDSVVIIKDGKVVRTGSMEEVTGDSSLEDVFLELDEGKVSS
ncbi:MAG: ABC transporter ATP-binding protein [Lachnospiraceae bacterium]|nr:ABC transporter ATP-binding protein [Lachnospiraceae bacterium]MBQ6259311.1 ABC transporter ATP-binding protein [Lachnospiraceae bacterium]